MRWNKVYILFIIGFLVVAGCFFWAHNRNSYENFLISEYKEVFPTNISASDGYRDSFDKPDRAAFEDYYKIIDPKLKRIPKERLFQVYEEVTQTTRFKSTQNELNWTELPSNMGGRVRAIMFDQSDTINYKKVWAGSVTGGLWVNDDITSPASTWKPVNDLWESLSVGAIATDPNNPKVIYVGTGEAQTAVTIYRESSAKGVGIYKSEDGGENWYLLESTAKFPYVIDLVVRDEYGESVLYAGIVSGTYKGKNHEAEPSDGLYRSGDGGTTWEQVLPLIPGSDVPYSPSDIELTPDGKIYVGTHRNISGVGGGTILHSADGIIWQISDDYKTLIESSEDKTQQIAGRVMLASTSASENSVYAVVAAGGFTQDNFIYYKGRYILRSDDNGKTWNEINPPLPDGSWSTLAWHALTIRISPLNDNEIFVGGLDLHKTSDGGATWRQLSSWHNFGAYRHENNYPYVHADQHNIIFKPNSPDTALFVNDGGVFLSGNTSDDSLLFEQKNKGFNSLQFYACALHPGYGEQKFVSGAQDNGTLISRGNPIDVNADMISSGDGAYCFFNEQKPDALITSVYHNQYYVSKANKESINLTHVINEFYGTGTFINPADYSSEFDRLLANATTFNLRFLDSMLVIDNVTDSTYSSKLIGVHTGAKVPFSAIKMMPATRGKAVAGTQSGELYLIEKINRTPISTSIGSFLFPSANISCIEFGADPDQMLITFSNYGVESVWYTSDGGNSWDNKDYNLPDIPVRWAVFNPQNPTQVFLATELGVWYTNNILAEEPEWYQSAGLPNVRVDMLRVRKSDNTILAASHGRGMFFSTLEVPSGMSQPNLKSSQKLFTYPNPVREKLTIEISGFDEGDSQLQVFEINGKLIRQDYLSGVNTIIINTKEWKSGVYIVVARQDDLIFTQKIIKSSNR